MENYKSLDNNNLTQGEYSNTNTIKQFPSPRMTHIEEVLAKHLYLYDMEEIFFKELNLPFLSVYHIISLLGVGAFGVVLEVANNITHEVSALKVGSQ